MSSMRNLVAVLALLLPFILVACSADSGGPATDEPEAEAATPAAAPDAAEPSAEAAAAMAASDEDNAGDPEDKQPWNGGRGSYCEPGQVNDLGVGRQCSTHADCAGFKASMCHRVKGEDRPAVCTVHCETDADCGDEAMCGLSRGWLRSCYPTHCTDFAYDETKMRPRTGEAPTHAGAAVCDAGFSFYEEGWGKPCFELGSCGDQYAKACSVAIYPPGVPRCWKECRSDEVCGENSYCGYTEVNTFTACQPRCPGEAHRALTDKPEQLDVCLVAGTIVDLNVNRYNVGQACTEDASCGEGSICGATMTTARKPEGCTRVCTADADCGRNSLCVDLEFGLPEDQRSGEASMACVPACWGI